MVRMTSCSVDGNLVSVEEAIDERNIADSRGTERPDFRCFECGQVVSPHKSSGYGVAHFEHSQRNPMCSLSDPLR